MARADLRDTMDYMWQVSCVLETAALKLRRIVRPDEGDFKESMMRFAIMGEDKGMIMPGGRDVYYKKEHFDALLNIIETASKNVRARYDWMHNMMLEEMLERKKKWEAEEERICYECRSLDGRTLYGKCRKCGAFARTFVGMVGRDM